MNRQERLESDRWKCGNWEQPEEKEHGEGCCCRECDPAAALEYFTET